MATMSTTELLDVFKNMTVLELNEFLKAFEDEFGVTAAAPVAEAAPRTVAFTNGAGTCADADRERAAARAAAIALVAASALGYAARCCVVSLMIALSQAGGADSRTLTAKSTMPSATSRSP